jgi:hypothetical protein
MTPFQTAVSAVRERKPFTSQREAEEIVRAVILAIRKPSEEVRLAGGDAADRYDLGLLVGLGEVTAIWKAMCDSLLGSGG